MKRLQVRLYATLVTSFFAFHAPAEEYVGVPKPEHAATNRAFQGIPSMAAAPVPPENSIRLEARFERTSVAVDGVAISRKVALSKRAAGLFEPFW